MMISRENVNVESIPHSGGLICSAVIGGYLMTRTYYGYTKGESVDLFRRYVAEEGGES